MNLPIGTFATTNILRHCYDRGDFSFGNPSAPQTVVLIGSCRILPFLNFFRAYNALNGNPLELLCFNPVEMWSGPGSEVAEGVNRVLSSYRFGKTDYLICEHLQNCGVLNTVQSSEQNIFNNLGCDPVVSIRLPNWNNLHIYDNETALYDAGYAAMSAESRVIELRQRTAENKARFLSHCAESSIPEIGPWVADNWLTTRFGWTNNHPSLAMVKKMLELVTRSMGISLTTEIGAHPLYSTDTYKSTGTVLTPIDYEANGWLF